MDIKLKKINDFTQEMTCKVSWEELKDSFKDEFDKRTDPRGRTYYWMKGNIVDKDKSTDMDGKAVREKYISITPIHFNVTNESYMGELNSQFSNE